MINLLAAGGLGPLHLRLHVSDDNTHPDLKMGTTQFLQKI